jgi:ribonucleoside-diphosphate reductase alpha chain
MSQQDATPIMRVKKRNGSFETVNVNKIVDAVSRFCNGLLFVDPLRVATKTISGLYDGATTVELDLLSIQTAALLTTEEPGYSMLAARLLSNVIQKEVANQDIQSFSQSIWHGYTEGLISEKLSSFVDMNARKLNAIIDESRNDLFEYFGMRTVYDRYLLRDPKTRAVIETPQYFFLRIACGLATTPAEAKEWYELFSSLDYLPSSPTLFNTGTINPQLSSCFLLDSPEDDLVAIYQKYSDTALLSKFSGGIGVSFSRIRSRGSLIKGTNGKSSGIIPFIKTLDSSVACVHQGGKRKGAACVYLETWHADIEEFLELRDNTGEYAMRAHNLNLANWIPDLFMERVEKGENWSLFDPKLVPYFPDLYGSAFVEAYLDAEAKGLAAKSIPAQDLFAKMMRTLAQTGQGWMCFKDRSNATCNQTGNGERVHLSNLCVAPETLVLTDKGHQIISLLVGRKTNVWNGKEWSEVEVAKTGENQKLLTVRLSDGRELDVTESHKWYIQDSYSGPPREARTIELEVGQKLIKYVAPIVEGDRNVENPYANGFFCGDGTTLDNGTARIYLYGEKKKLFNKFDIDIVWRESSDRLQGETTVLKVKFSVPSARDTIKDRLTWLAGWLDADGTVHTNGENESISGASINLRFLKNIQSMLLTTGVNAKVTLMREDSESFLPKNDGTGDYSMYPTKRIWRLLINSSDTQRLLEWGIPLNRLRVKKREPQRTAAHFAVVVEVLDKGRIDDTYCFTEPKRHMGVFNGILTGNCTEILEVNSSQHTAVCNLGSINLGRHVVDGEFDFNKLARTVNNAVRQLDRVIDSTIYPILSARDSNLEWRPIGLGCMGLQDVFFKLGLAFDSDEAHLLSTKISEAIYRGALYTSCDLAEHYGKFPAFDKSRSAKGEVQFDYWQQRLGVSLGVSLNEWEPLRKRIQKVGLRNSLLIAIAPTATIASIAGCYECIEPAVSNLFKRETMSGEFLQINGYLVEVLRTYGLWNDDIRSKIITGDGSIQHISEIPEDIRRRFRTVWEIPQKALIDLAAARGAFIDQSQSLNLFVESPTISKISSMYMYAWKSGLKTTYYLRSRPATSIKKTTVRTVGTEKLPTTIDPAALACSLENPESCEACT